MERRRKTFGPFFLIAMACLGLALAAAASWIVRSYQTAASMGPTWRIVYVATVAAGGGLFGVATLWLLLRLWSRSRRKIRRRSRRAKDPSQLSLAEQETEIAENLAATDDLKAELPAESELSRQLEPMAEGLREKRAALRLEIVAFGTVSSGKSSLLNALAGRDIFQTDPRGGTTRQRNEIPWPGADRVVLVDTPGLAEIDRPDHQAAEAAKDADLVLLVVDGPLRHFEFELFDRLARMEKRVIVCLNKEDWYDDRQRADLLGQIAEQAADRIRPEDVIAVRSRPTRRTRKRVGPDGAEFDEPVEVPQEIQPLADRMLHVVKHEGRQLLLANMLLQSRGLIEQAKRRVRESLDARAWAIVDRHAWGAGGAAALTPFPVIDLAAGCGISTKMVLDLARVYRQDVDLDVAVSLLGQQGKNVVAVLGTSAAAPAVTSVAASLLKTVPGVGTLAGGILQGIVQALVTRWIGAVFVEYFKNRMQAPPEGMAELARQQWQRVTAPEELRKLIAAIKIRNSGAADPPPDAGTREAMTEEPS